MKRRPRVKVGSSGEQRGGFRGGFREMRIGDDWVHVGRERVHVPTSLTRYQVSLLAGLGTQQLVIAKILGINQATLVKHYKDEMEVGRARANMAVASRLFRTACGDSDKALAAQCFWLRTRGGPAFQIADRLEVSGLGGAPIQVKGSAGEQDLATQFFALLKRLERDDLETDPEAD